MPSPVCHILPIYGRQAAGGTADERGFTPMEIPTPMICVPRRASAVLDPLRPAPFAFPGTRLSKRLPDLIAAPHAFPSHRGGCSHDGVQNRGVLSVENWDPYRPPSSNTWTANNLRAAQKNRHVQNSQNIGRHCVPASCTLAPNSRCPHRISSNRDSSTCTLRQREWGHK
jgi:hypothetical protein